MTQRHGSVFTVKYLKASHLAIQKFIAGTPLDSLRELEGDLPLPRLSSGLPRFIPIYDRRSIKQGNPFIIRFWLTLFSIYRIIRIPGILKLNTITDPFSGNIDDLNNLNQSLFTISRKFKNKFSHQIFSKEFGLLPLETSSPSSRVS